MEWYVAALEKYADFSGRARRKEYWLFTVITFLINVAVTKLGSVVFAGSLLGMLFSLAMMVPGMAVGVRRLHDTGRSAWFSLLALVPIVGWITLLGFAFQEGTPGPNAYGPNPKETVIGAMPA